MTSVMLSLYAIMLRIYIRKPSELSADKVQAV